MPDPFGPLTAAARNAGNALGLIDVDPGNNIGGSSLTIEELAGEKRTITLMGRAMPYRGAPWSGEQKSKLTFYPGNPVGVQQVLGPTEDVTTLNGMWKDRFVKGAVEVFEGSATNLPGIGSALNIPTISSLPDGFGPDGFDTAERLIQLFHSIRRSGVPLKVTWASEVRFGILKYFEAVYDRIQDVEWTMDFEWSAVDDVRLRRSAEVAVPASDVFNLLNTALDIISQADDITRSFNAALVSSITNVQGLVSDLFGILRVIDTVIDTPASVFGALRSSFLELDRELTELIRRIADPRWNTTPQAVRLFGQSQSALTVREQRSSATNGKIQFDRNRRSEAKAFQNLRRVSERAVNDRLQQRNPKTTRKVTVRQSSTLYDISTQFYGSPDFANYIASVNSLALGNVAAGTTLRLPPRPNAGLANVEITGGINKNDCPPAFDENCRLLADC